MSLRLLLSTKQSLKSIKYSTVIPTAATMLKYQQLRGFHDTPNKQNTTINNVIPQVPTPSSSIPSSSASSSSSSSPLVSQPLGSKLSSTEYLKAFDNKELMSFS